MNDDLEKNLCRFRLVRPPHPFDRRMEELFAASTTSSPSAHRNRWKWLALPAAAAIAACGIIISRRAVSPPPIQPVFYEIEATGVMREWLLSPPRDSLTAPKVIVTVDQ